MQKIKQEIKDTQDRHITERQEQEKIQEQLMRTMKLNQLILENFVPLDERTRMENHAYFEEEEEAWRIKPLALLSRSEDYADG